MIISALARLQKQMDRTQGLLCGSGRLSMRQCRRRSGVEFAQLIWSPNCSNACVTTQTLTAWEQEGCQRNIESSWAQHFGTPSMHDSVELGERVCQQEGRGGAKLGMYTTLFVSFVFMERVRNGRQMTPYAGPMPRDYLSHCSALAHPPPDTSLAGHSL
jgi:hypothetical protein